MAEITKLFLSFKDTMDNIKSGNFKPEIISEPKTGKVIDFYPFESKQFEGFDKERFLSISELLESFYYQKDNLYHIQQKAHDMRRIVLNNIERCAKKKDKGYSTYGNMVS